MKSEIHPKYGPAVIRCACGNVIETRSTRESISTDVCSACHPFFTGTQKLIDIAGRIDKFKKRFEGKVVSNKKVRKSKQIISFEPTVQTAPEAPQPARQSPAGGPARPSGGSKASGKKKPAGHTAQKK